MWFSIWKDDLTEKFPVTWTNHHSLSWSWFIPVSCWIVFWNSEKRAISQSFKSLLEQTPTLCSPYFNSSLLLLAQGVYIRVTCLKTLCPKVVFKFEEWIWKFQFQISEKLYYDLKVINWWFRGSMGKWCSWGAWKEKLNKFRGLFMYSA